MENILQKIRDDISNLSEHIDKRLSKIEIDHFRDHNSKIDAKDTKIDQLNENIKTKDEELRKKNEELTNKDEELADKQRKIDDLNDQLKRYIKETSNSCIKGRLFEENIVKPQLQKLIDSIPNLNLDITRTIAGQGDATIEELNINVDTGKDNLIKCNAEAKNYTDVSIRGVHIVQAVTNAINKNANCVLLIYNELPDYAGNMYDFGEDVKNKFPKDLNFDRNMCLACTPETIQFAFSILLCRFKRTNYTISCEKEKFLNDFIRFMDEYVRFVNPFFSSYTLKKMEEYSKKIASLGADLVVDSSNVQNCDDKLKHMQNMIRQIVGKMVSTRESEKQPRGSHIPKLFGVYPNKLDDDTCDRPSKRPREDKDIL